MDIKILYGDEDLVVLDKPSGIVVNRAESVKEKTVQDWVEKNIKNIEYRVENKENKTDFHGRSGVVHRLDKETSGCLIVAKSENAFYNLQRQFKERRVEKEYIALVHGKVKVGRGTIKVPVGRSKFDRQKFGVTPEGKESNTEYRVEKHLEQRGKPYTLLKLHPKTGRTHQIRVHLKYFGHPIVADKKYVGRKRYKEDSKWCPRLFLHASKIELRQPTSGEKIGIMSKLPADLKKIINISDTL